MMEIHIQLSGIELGPFSEKQIQEYLAEGLASPLDMARLEGTADWETVEIVLAKMPALAPSPELIPAEIFSEESSFEPEPIGIPSPEPEPMARGSRSTSFPRWSRSRLHNLNLSQSPRKHLLPSRFPWLFQRLYLSRSLRKRLFLSRFSPLFHRLNPLPSRRRHPQRLNQSLLKNTPGKSLFAVLTSTQRTKRKQQGKIVIQPMLPLETAVRPKARAVTPPVSVPPLREKASPPPSPVPQVIPPPAQETPPARETLRVKINVPRRKASPPSPPIPPVTAPAARETPPVRETLRVKIKVPPEPLLLKIRCGKKIAHGCSADSGKGHSGSTR